MSSIRMQPQFIQTDFKREYLFRTCSVANDLVTSPSDSFQVAVLLRCVVLAHYETFVFTHFVNFNRTATGSAASIATSEYGNVPRRIGQNEKQSSRNGKRTPNKPCSRPKCL